MSDPGITFAVFFRATRKDLGLTQSQASEKLGVSLNTIRSWESGRREPPDSPIRSKSQILRELESQ